MLTRIRALIVFFVIALVLSGVTAFPIQTQLEILEPLFGEAAWVASVWPELGAWLQYVLRGYREVNVSYPFMGYGTDWLAFAHIAIAAAFWGVWRDPARNIWVVEWAMVCSLGVFVLAIVCGPIRGIPWFWTLADCSFGLFALPPLLWLKREIQQLPSGPAAPASAAA